MRVCFGGLERSVTRPTPLLSLRLLYKRYRVGVSVPPQRRKALVQKGFNFTSFVERYFRQPEIVLSRNEYRRRVGFQPTSKPIGLHNTK